MPIDTLLPLCSLDEVNTATSYCLPFQEKKKMKKKNLAKYS